MPRPKPQQKHAARVLQCFWRLQIAQKNLTHHLFQRLVAAMGPRSKALWTCEYTQARLPVQLLADAVAHRIYMREMLRRRRNEPRGHPKTKFILDAFLITYFSANTFEHLGDKEQVLCICVVIAQHHFDEIFSGPVAERVSIGQENGENRR